MTETLVNTGSGTRQIEAPDNLFSDKFHDSSAKEPCTICGRETSRKNASGVIVTEGGATLVHPADADAEYAYNMAPGNSNGWMGWFAVGSECIKKIPAEFRAPNPRKGA